MSDFPSLVDSTDGWMYDAECRGTGFLDFFPDTMSQASAARAVAMCNRCPVQTECAQYAIINNIEYGIYGGLSPRARREIASSTTDRDRTHETETYNWYTHYKNAGRTDPVQATSKQLGISTATVYHHVRIIKFATLLQKRQK